MPAGLGRREPDHRRDRGRARAWALHTLYLWESGGGGATPRQALNRLLQTRRVAPRRVPFLERLIQVVEEHLSEIDGALESVLENWRLERLSVTDRSVLRLGAAEILFVPEVPPKVAIQEALRLAEAYGGGEDSPKFINGVLDALYKRFRWPAPTGEGRGPGP